MAELSAESRKKMKPKTFGLPSKAKTAKGRAEGGSYPMPDKAHARNAKARVAQHGTPAEKAKVNAKADKILGKDKK